jgi:hypothetical protein
MSSKFTPKIVISVNSQNDIDRFNSFLNHPNYAGKRTAILNFYPKIAEGIKKGQNEKELIADIIPDMYERYGKEINKIVEAAKKELQQSEIVFKTLASYMDFPKLAQKTYEANPTFLPFSPLGDNHFFFSIATQIANKKIDTQKIVLIAVHEVSHFILFEQLKKIPNLKLNHPASHYFKESLAAAIMDQKEFRDFFNYPKTFGCDCYPGNNELHQLFINFKNKKYNIVTFFEKIILQNPKGYQAGLNWSLNEFLKNQNQFKEKWAIWNKILSAKNKNPKLVKEYQQEIKI